LVKVVGGVGHLSLALVLGLADYSERHLVLEDVVDLLGQRQRIVRLDDLVFEVEYVQRVRVSLVDKHVVLFVVSGYQESVRHVQVSVELQDALDVRCLHELASIGERVDAGMADHLHLSLLDVFLPAGKVLSVVEVIFLTLRVSELLSNAVGDLLPLFGGVVGVDKHNKVVFGHCEVLVNLLLALEDRVFD